MKSKQFLLLIAILLIPLVVVAIWFTANRSSGTTFFNPNNITNPIKPTPLPLLEYSFPNLSVDIPQASQIKTEGLLDETPDYTSYLFSYVSKERKVTGQMNLPQTATPSSGFPVIVMLRGWVDPANYQTGIGTRNAAAVFARNGYVTLAPDFLGYGGSDDPDVDPLAARLRRPVTVLDLLASIQSLPFVDTDRVGIWAHSNGGQIALSILEITKKSYPTTLWAPVSKGFPYSILYYTDDYSDGGKELRRVLADFELDYDVFDYSIDKYWQDIQAPLQLHQGAIDDAVPLEWSNQLYQTLDNLDKDIQYYTYPGTDHQLRQSWNTVIARDVDFFNEYLK